jgi:hypothetical protein
LNDQTRFVIFNIAKRVFVSSQISHGRRAAFYPAQNTHHRGINQLHTFQRDSAQFEDGFFRHFRLTTCRVFLILHPRKAKDQRGDS